MSLLNRTKMLSEAVLMLGKLGVGLTFYGFKRAYIFTKDIYGKYASAD